jgi:hypothetical protein
LAGHFLGLPLRCDPFPFLALGGRRIPELPGRTRSGIGRRAACGPFSPEATLQDRLHLAAFPPRRLQEQGILLRTGQIFDPSGQLAC